MLQTLRGKQKYQITNGGVEKIKLSRLLAQRIKVAPHSFLSAHALISKISRWRKLSNSTPKTRAKSRSEMPTNMASKLL